MIMMMSSITILMILVMTQVHACNYDHGKSIVSLYNNYNQGII